MKRCSNQSELGRQQAELHLHNLRRKEQGEDHIDKFGFHTHTCCGFLPQSNNWRDMWVESLRSPLPLMVRG